MLIASIAMQVVLSAVCQPKAEVLPQECRSSQLGFSIRYPEGWEKGRILMCGNTYMGLDEEGMRRAAIYPIRLGSVERDKYFGMSITVWREIDEEGRKQAYPNGAPGRAAFSIPALPNVTRRVNTDIAYLGNDTLVPSWTATYSVEQGSRLIQLAGSCNAYDRAKYEPIFDEMARTLVLFDPTEDRRQEGGLKTHRTPRFSFEYPGPWIVTGVPHDDEEATKVSDSGTLLGPDHAKRVMWPVAGQRLTFGVYRQRYETVLNHDEAVKAVLALCEEPKKKGSLKVQTTSFSTTSGVLGTRIVATDSRRTHAMRKQKKKSEAWAKEKGQPVPLIGMGDTSVWYVLALDAGTAVYFHDRDCASIELEKTLSQYDAIVRSFKVIRRPGEPEPVVPLSH